MSLQLDNSNILGGRICCIRVNSSIEEFLKLAEGLGWSTSGAAAA